jgi:HK97 family phage prohead protease
MERKTFDFKGTLDDAGILEGYGAVYGNIDSYKDVIKEQSCKNVQEFIRDGSILVGHEWGDIGIATIEDAKEDSNGLFFRAKFHSDDVAQRYRLRAQERLDRGKSLGLSIGYMTMESEQGKQDNTDVRFITAWACKEISLVPVPANDRAGATGVKSFEDKTDGAFAALDDLSEEWGRIRLLRVKDGRNWPSDLNRSRIEAFAAKCKELLSTFDELLLTPDLNTVSESDLASVHLAFMRDRLQMAGLL